MPSYADDLLVNLAASLTYDLLQAGAARLKRAALGAPQEQALRRAYQAGFAAALRSSAAGLSRDEATLAADILHDFVAAPGVSDGLLALALEGAAGPDLAALRAAFDALDFDRATLPLDFDRAMAGFYDGLSAGLVVEAGQETSPLYNRVSLGRLLMVQALLRDQQRSLDAVSAQVQALPAAVGQAVEEIVQARLAGRPLPALDQLPAGVVGVTLDGVRAGGDITIKDVIVQVIQLLPPPAPVRLAAPPPPDTFAGRSAELAELTRILLHDGSAAISAAAAGMGGIGKTTVAQKLGVDLAERFPGGVLWLDVGFGAAPADLVDRLALKAAVDLAGEPRLERRAALLQATLAQRGRLLAVLDDLWDVDLGRWALAHLLPPDRALLVTSRDSALCRALCHHVARLDALPEREALQLLANILGPLEGQSAAAGQVVALLEGLPLALDLAARLCDDGPADLPWLVRRLQQQSALDILKLPGQEVRESSVEACLALSYDRLDEDLRRRFRSLGVFAPAPFDLAALAAVWDDDQLDAAEAAARQLQRRGLLRRVALGAGAQADPTAAYAQHGLLRAYALALLQRDAHQSPSGEGAGDAPAARHAGHFQRLPGRDGENWPAAELFWEQIEHAWQRASSAGPGRSLDFYRGLRVFLYLRGRHANQISWIETILAAPDDSLVPPKDRGLLINNLAWVYSALGEKGRALELCEQALPLRRQVGDKAGEANTLSHMGAVYSDLGEKGWALELYEQALPLLRQVGDRAGEAYTLTNMGAVYDDLGEKGRALELYEQALPLRRQVGDKAGEAVTLSNMGKVYSDLGQKWRALALYGRALPLRRQVGDKAGEAVTLSNMGTVYSDLGQKWRALALFEQALLLLCQAGARWGESATRYNMAMVHEALGDLAAAEEQLRQVVALDEAIGRPDLSSDRAALARIQALRAASAGGGR